MYIPIIQSFPQFYNARSRYPTFTGNAGFLQKGGPWGCQGEMGTWKGFHGFRGFKALHDHLVTFHFGCGVCNSGT